MNNVLALGRLLGVSMLVFVLTACGGGGGTGGVSGGSSAGGGSGGSAGGSGGGTGGSGGSGTGGSGGGSGGIDTSAFNFGTADNMQSANGLRFDDNTVAMEDVETLPITIKVARFITDYDTGMTTLVVEDQTVTFDSGGIATAGAEKRLTLNGGTLVFDLGAATDGDGTTYSSFEEDLGSYSGVFGLTATSPDGVTGTDTTGFYVIGFETDPFVALAPSAGTANYTGAFSGAGQVLDLTGALQQAGVDIGGTIALEINFVNDGVNGTLDGWLDYGGGMNFDMTLADAGFTGNGFDGAVSYDCGSGETCTSTSKIGGVLFGSSSQELSGIIGFDETIEDGAMGDMRFVGAGGFLTSKTPD